MARRPISVCRLRILLVSGYPDKQESECVERNFIVNYEGIQVDRRLWFYKGAIITTIKHAI